MASISRSTPPVPSVNEDQVVEARNKRNRELAIHHANIIQQRKDTESSILAALEELIDFPTTSQADPHNPSSEDIQSFRELVKPFTILDYKDLLEERNIAGKCGYVFCPRPLKPAAGGGGNFMRIVRGREKEHQYNTSNDLELKVVPNSKFEKWCDKWCAEQAFKIQVQLSEVPAWERVSRPKGLIITSDHISPNGLKAENSQNTSDYTRDEEQHRSEDTRKSFADLALERGDRSETGKGQVKVHIQHRERATPVSLPVRDLGQDNSSGAIEGYVPRTTTTASKANHTHGNNGHRPNPFTKERGDAEDEMNTDWDLS